MRRAGAVLGLLLVCGCASSPASPTSGQASGTNSTTTTSTSVTGGRAPLAAPGTTMAETGSDAPSGPGRLRDATAELGLDEPLRGLRGHAVATADVNGDGWPDLFVGTFADRPVEEYRQRGATGPAPDRLLLGGPDGFHLDDAFPGRLGRSAGAHFADLDGDGDQDLIVSRNLRPGRPVAAPSEIYRNDGGQLRSTVVLDDHRGGRAVGTTDYDGDGLLDIVLVEDRWSGGSTGVFHNEGDLGFRDATAEAGLPAGVYGLGLGIADLDGDGVEDLLVGGSNRIFVNRDGRFREVETSTFDWELPGDEDDPAHVAIADLDGDDRPDIVIGQHFNSTLDEGRPQAVRVYLNRGDDATGLPTFEDVTEQAGSVPLATKSPQVLAVDLDGDGHPELVTTASTTDGQPLVFSTQGSSPRDGLTLTPSGSVSGPHYWIDAVVLDANRDSRPDVFVVEWEPSTGSRLYLNEPRP